METYFLDRAKLYYQLILWSVGSSVPLSLFIRSAEVNSPLKEIIVFGPAAIGLLAAPIGMYYILKSYKLKEQNKKQKLVYLIGILLINTLGIALIVTMLTKGTTIYQ